MNYEYQINAISFFGMLHHENATEVYKCTIYTITTDNTVNDDIIEIMPNEHLLYNKDNNCHN